MQKLILLLIVAAILPNFAFAQTPTVTAKWTADKKLVLSDLPAKDQAIEMATPAHRLNKPDELKDICSRMSNYFATWKASEDGTKVLIYLHRDANPDWDRETWQMHLTRMAGVYLME